MTELLNTASEKPQLAVIFLNKRINQRFFVKDGNRLVNPPPGCIIDRGLVVQDGSEGAGGLGKPFDFFILPYSSTQGCIRPTHVYVAMNQTDLSKRTTEEFVFSLCHGYFNWPGGIRVPAPCMYAHKVAEFYTNTGICDKKPNLDHKFAKTVSEKVRSIEDRLHYL